MQKLPYSTHSAKSNYGGRTKRSLAHDVTADIDRAIKRKWFASRNRPHLKTTDLNRNKTVYHPQVYAYRVGSLIRL